MSSIECRSEKQFYWSKSGRTTIKQESDLFQKSLLRDEDDGYKCEPWSQDDRCKQENYNQDIRDYTFEVMNRIGINW